MRIVVGALLGALSAGGAAAQEVTLPALQVDSNVVYGRYSGLALLMNVHRPAVPNGLGVVYVPGSGFHTPLGYGAAPITQWTEPWVPALVRAGYTVFVVNHRAAPRFRHPSALEDVGRAVRYVRHNAARWGIRPAPLAGAGYSSGATLATLIGMRPADGDSAADDPVERERTVLACVVAGGAAFDFRTLSTPVALPIAGSYLGATIVLGYPKTGDEYRLYADASPVTHVSPGDAALLIVHGEADEVLPFSQAEAMAAAAEAAGVPVRLLRIPGAGHGRLSVPGGPDVMAETVRWLDACMGGATGSSRSSEARQTGT